MQERLWDILIYPISNNTAQTVMVKFSDGTNPFLFLRDPIAKSWIVIRDTEKDITMALKSNGIWPGSITGEEGLGKCGQSDVVTIFPDAQLVEIESESVFKEMLLPRAEEEAFDIHDTLDTRVVFYKRLKHLIDKDGE